MFALALTCLENPPLLLSKHEYVQTDDTLTDMQLVHGVGLIFKIDEVFEKRSSCPKLESLKSFSCFCRKLNYIEANLK